MAKLPMLVSQRAAVRGRLLKMAVGDRVSYAEMSALVGRDCQKSGRHIVNAVMRELEEESSIVFVCEMNQGWARIADHDKIRTADRMRGSLRRKSKKMGRRVRAVDDYSKLSPEDQRTHAALMVVSEVCRQMTSAKAKKRLSIVAPPTVDIPKLIEAFGGKKKP